VDGCRNAGCAERHRRSARPVPPIVGRPAPRHALLIAAVTALTVLAALRA
jgi:hypothetical protein